MRACRGVFPGEAHVVHVAGYRDAFLGAGDEPRLSELELGASGGADAGGVEAHAVLADPAHAGGGVGEQGDGGVRDPAAGPDQEDGEVGSGGRGPRGPC